MTSLAKIARLKNLVESLDLVDELERRELGAFQSVSLPDHLLHIVTNGEVSQWAEGRPEVLRKSTVVWYHNNESVRGFILRAPWRFITINFQAPALPPPRDDRRVFSARAPSRAPSKPPPACRPGDDCGNSGSASPAA